MILAVDQGTTGTTCLIVDAGLRPVGRGYRELQQHYPQPGWVEHDADEIWESVLGAAGDALREAGLAARDLLGIGITNQRETAVAWDRNTGRPLHRAIVWQDRRTADACRRLPAELIRQRTGLVPDPYFSATKWRWLLDATGAGPRVALGTVDSWLVWRLTVGGAHVTDPTNASRTMLYSLESAGWDRELLELLGIDAQQLPRVVASSGVAGEAELLGARVPVAGLAGDQQSALFGQACFRPGAAKATYGTGSFVLINQGSDSAPPPEGLLKTAAAQPGVFALEGSVFVAGAALQWLRDGLGVIADSAESEALARSVESTGGVYFVPALAGLGSPHWDPDARGLICGITRGTTRAHLARAALEAIALQVADVLDAAGLPPDALRADGGASANAWLMQLQADLLGAPVEVAAEREMTALGAAALAGLALGVWDSPAALEAAWRAGARYEPVMSRDQVERLTAGWREALARTRSQL
ncbi:MAG: FGGY family carbohydrate kinase [Gaiellales bacterium]